MTPARQPQECKTCIHDGKFETQCCVMSGHYYNVCAISKIQVIEGKPIIRCSTHTSAPAPEQYCKYDSRTSPKHVCESCRGLRPRWCTFPIISPPTPALFQIEPNSHDYTIGQIVEINENIQKQRKEAAKAAREQVLKLVWIEVQSCGVSKEVFEGISRNVIAKSVRTQQEPQQEGRL